MLPLQLCAIDDEPGQVGCEKGVPLDAECEFSQLTPAHEELQLSIRNAENPCRVVAVVAGSGEHGPQEVLDLAISLDWIRFRYATPLLRRRHRPLLQHALGSSARHLTLLEKALCCQRRDICGFDSVSCCTYLRGALVFPGLRLPGIRCHAANSAQSAQRGALFIGEKLETRQTEQSLNCLNPLKTLALPRGLHGVSIFNVLRESGTAILPTGSLGFFTASVPPDAQQPLRDRALDAPSSR